MGNMKFMKRLSERDNNSPQRPEDYAAVLVMILLLIDVALQIVTRYVFNNPLGWTEEIARYLLVLLTFIGAPIAVRNNSNVSLDFILTSAPLPVRKVLNTVTTLIELFFYACGTYLSWKMAVFSKNRFLVTVRISRAVVYGVIMISFAFMTCRCLIRLVRLLRRTKEAQT